MLYLSDEYKFKSTVIFICTYASVMLSHDEFIFRAMIVTGNFKLCPSNSRFHSLSSNFQDILHCPMFPILGSSELVEEEKVYLLTDLETSLDEHSINASSRRIKDNYLQRRKLGSCLKFRL
jgi:hypothetical protein